ncbi:FAD/NAD(P)-binding domain-containing protein [Aspergillus heteromorphus CBS 117.55]|uniref:FAD/NAD(P)-binding domain-containing protein n=1 Tax=Aspergillus heteromorphus CBS 117.55 TaxID=1448321 RepID=A0A317UXJ1_9EURO|nr:FAD/NAD(P)-binding domain-containing protein [Aspergillus heteromorphus CBS 117.55]PWY66753.1 FAD/NAD(P)-binding domain-containing protein [Aspergillus heteromorphus CBS 117.55]
MAIPANCTVLVVGGGPAGSYTASVLAREGIDTVLLESEAFPRYHIGESLLPSSRYFLDFIDLYDKFNNHGFVQKTGAAFKFVPDARVDEYTDFLAAGGAGNHAWNVIRAEADDLLFRHAGDSGAKAFDGVKVTEIQFAASPDEPGRPISASWARKGGSTGDIAFEYLVDASGRAGLVSTQYMKNRHFNPGLKNVATWGYWTGIRTYEKGTPRENAPYFEGLTDGSGWVWYIPLHDGTTSVGVVLQQAQASVKRKGMGHADFYHATLQEAPNVARLMDGAQLQSGLKSASDWSYHASTYAGPFLRIIGDAGCFIDPLFSSGVHLAMATGLSAAVTICAAHRGDCSEEAAGSWHTKKVTESYTRFLLVVTSALEQIYGRDRHILNELEEMDFGRAFAHFRPIIQGTIDAGGKLSRSKAAQSVDFCVQVLQKVLASTAENGATRKGEPDTGALGLIRPDDRSREPVRKIMQMHRVLDLSHFTTDVIDGMASNVQRGDLGLVRAIDK